MERLQKTLGTHHKTVSSYMFWGAKRGSLSHLGLYLYLRQWLTGRMSTLTVHHPVEWRGNGLCNFWKSKVVVSPSDGVPQTIRCCPVGRSAVTAAATANWTLTVRLVIFLNFCGHFTHYFIGKYVLHHNDITLEYSHENDKLQGLNTHWVENRKKSCASAIRFVHWCLSRWRDPVSSDDGYYGFELTKPRSTFVESIPQQSRAGPRPV